MIQEKLKPKKSLINRENALLMRQTPKWMQAFALLMLFVGSGGIIGSIIFKIDEVVTAPGRLIVSEGREDVETPAGGKVSKVLVKDGDYVEVGSLLLEFDTTLALEEKQKAIKLIDLEKRGLGHEINTIKLQKNVIEKRLETQTALAQGYSDLLEVGSVSRTQYTQVQDKLLEIRNQLLSMDERLRSTEINSEKRIQELTYSLQSANKKLAYQNIIAMKSGVVFDLQASEGGVLQAGSKIMSIVPNGKFDASIYVPNKDIGFVKIGQKAKVRIDAYPSSRYGELNGEVSLIGADVLPPDNTSNSYRFPINLTLDKSWLMAGEIKIPLRAGMSITSNLKIREKRLITLVSDFFSGQTESIKALRGG
ncbi:HlyD family efflux transporter periplasmic adaptor subunit [Synechococcus sp. AH-551-A10]|nr:HlyD family efflux transporter periplasmic adaptor subunit [Synechococcus sp. AH-551-A10]MDB4682139.1 HlyD family efflux transporter periplasmic adaptor subunit [Synechococcus sp. AH-551-A10]